MLQPWRKIRGASILFLLLRGLDGWPTTGLSRRKNRDGVCAVVALGIVLMLAPLLGSGLWHIWLTQGIYFYVLQSADDSSSKMTYNLCSLVHITCVSKINQWIIVVKWCFVVFLRKYLRGLIVIEVVELTHQDFVMLFSVWDILSPNVNGLSEQEDKLWVGDSMMWSIQDKLGFTLLWYLGILDAVQEQICWITYYGSKPSLILIGSLHSMHE